MVKGKNGKIYDKISVYDNEGKTFDRYTIVVNNDLNDGVYGMSHNPEYPAGFNIWSGECCQEALDEMKQLDTIPEEIHRAVIRRANEYFGTCRYYD